MPLHAGSYSLHEIRDGLLQVDGGVIFGAVPRSTWERLHPPDALNRIRLALRCLLIDAGHRKILVGTGIGNKPGAPRLAQLSVDRDTINFDAELARAGVAREDITDVVLTHLHLDHAGGATRQTGCGRSVLAFPNATFHLQRRQWRWAQHPSDHDLAAFHRSDFELLEHSGRLHLLDGESEICDGVQVCVTEGHTVGMQVVRVQSADSDTKVVYCGDLIPTRAHLPPSVHLAYDLNPLALIEEKKMLLAMAVEEDAILFLEHDPEVAACRVRDVEGVVVAGERVAF